MKKFSLFLIVCWLVLGVLNITYFINTCDPDKLTIAFLDFVLAFDNYIDYKF